MSLEDYKPLHKGGNDEALYNMGITRPNEYGLCRF